MIAAALVAAEEEVNPVDEIVGTIVAIVVFAVVIVAMIAGVVLFVLYVARKARNAQKQAAAEAAAHHAREQTERRHAEVRAVAASVPPGTRCPNCNAPLELDLEGSCRYCRQRWTGLGSA